MVGNAVKKLLKVTLNVFIITIGAATTISANDSAIVYKEPVTEIVYEASFWGGRRVNHIVLTNYNLMPRLKVWVTFNIENSETKQRSNEFVVHDSVWNKAMAMLKQTDSSSTPSISGPVKRDVAFKLMVYTGSRNNKKIYGNKINATSLIQYLRNTSNSYTDILNE